MSSQKGSSRRSELVMVRPPSARRRPVYAVLLLLTIVLGLSSRHFSTLLPRLLAKNAGDVLYATMAFWLAGLLSPRLSTLKAAVAALAFCFLIEFTKFLPMPWLVALRHRAWGHLVLGTGFHPSNLVCYVIGVLLAVSVERGLCLQRANRPGTKAKV